MQSLFFFIYFGCLLLSAILAFAHGRQLRSRRLFILAPYLLLVAVQELSLYYYVYYSTAGSIAVVYNIYRLVTTLLFALIYYRTPFMARWKPVIGGLALTYLLAALVTYCFSDSIFTTNTYLTLLRGVVMSACALLFLFSYFNLDDRKEEQFHRPLLWITIGIAVFYPVVSISLALQEYLLEFHATLFGFKLYQIIPQLMSVFMYGCFSYAFYLCRKKD